MAGGKLHPQFIVLSFFLIALLYADFKSTAYISLLNGFY